MEIKISVQPKIGQIITVRGTPCRIFKVYRLGTVDVVSLCGTRAFRVTGLAFVG